MSQETNFEAIKAEILSRAKEARACTEQYGRAYKSETLQELCNVIKDNFHWCYNNKVITPDLLMQYREDFAQNEIFINISVQSGYLLCDNATVEAWGNATVKACDNATVEAWGNAYCTSYCTIECKLSDNAIYRVRSTNTIYYSSDKINFIKQ